MMRTFVLFTLTAAALVWVGGVEDIRPDRRNVPGSVICLVGTAVILFGPRA